MCFFLKGFGALIIVEALIAATLLFRKELKLFAVYFGNNPNIEENKYRNHAYYTFLNVLNH